MPIKFVECINQVKLLQCNYIFICNNIKSVIKYYTKQNSTVFTCFLDAAKAFDRVSHWTLFSKMIKRNVPLVVVRIIALI